MGISSLTNRSWKRLSATSFSSVSKVITITPFSIALSTQFLVQGGESIYGSSPFPDEFHSRLVACAGAGTGEPNSNGTQFFITLVSTDFLDKKHTIFGKVTTGDSIYNLLHLGEVETD